MKILTLILVWLGMLFSTVVTVVVVAVANPSIMITLFFVAMWVLSITQGLKILDEEQ
jgi:hypothetical protein